VTNVSTCFISLCSTSDPIFTRRVVECSIMAPVLRDARTLHFCPVILTVLFMQKVFCENLGRSDILPVV